MGRALDRFRVLPLADSAVEPQPELAGRDLFEHYGVPIEPRPPNRPRPLVEVHACARCGWWLELGSREPCPICLAEAVEAAESSDV